MKKIQSVLAGLLSICLLTCSAFAMEFPDVPEDSDYATAIANISDLGIMVGSSNGNFNPDQIVSRCEMATIICRMLGTSENLSKSEVFTDVPTTHWANAYVGKVAELGIVNGYGNGKFGPGDPVTYEQAITMIVRTIGEGDKAISYGGYPNGFIQVAQEKNLLNGIQAIQGQGLCRGAVAMLLYNYYITQSNPGTSSNVGEHTHNYIEKTVPGAGGHYEQVLVGNEKVETIIGTYWIIECKCCKKIFEDSETFSWHTKPANPDAPESCWGAASNMYQRNRYNIEYQPVYETRWVEDTPATIRVCSICGQQEP